ncbi:hypothetical protein [Cysteiniphilum sp. 6C5]|uniref:hypothetical protein n=1 Tax=unclassified Cysteiniphilum TaxID=2610889 RepID=UPI003F84F2CA
MRNLYHNLKHILLAGLINVLLINMSFADEVKGFKSWAAGIVTLFEQIKTFLVFICLLIGMWYLILGLLQLRKSLTPQGAQQDILKQAFGHIVIGVILISVVAFIQMFQVSIDNNAGDTSKPISTFSVDSNALNNN